MVFDSSGDIERKHNPLYNHRLLVYESIKGWIKESLPHQVWGNSWERIVEELLGICHYPCRVMYVSIALPVL